MSTFSFVLKSTSEIAKPMSKFECKQTWQKTLATKVVRRPAALLLDPGTCIPQTPWLGPFWKISGSTCEPLYCKILGSPMACAHAELENVLLRIWQHPSNFWSRPRMTLPEIAPNKRLVGAIGSHSGFTVVIHNNGRNVFLWRPLNYTLPVQLNYSNAMFFFYSLSASWPVRDLTDRQLVIGVRTLRTQEISAPCVCCRSVSNFSLVPKCPRDTSAPKCIRHFAPRIKKMHRMSPWC